MVSSCGLVLVPPQFLQGKPPGTSTGIRFSLLYISARSRYSIITSLIWQFSLWTVPQKRQIMVIYTSNTANPWWAKITSSLTVPSNVRVIATPTAYIVGSPNTQIAFSNPFLSECWQQCAEIELVHTEYEFPRLWGLSPVFMRPCDVFSVDSSDNSWFFSLWGNFVPSLSLRVGVPLGFSSFGRLQRFARFVPFLNKCR